MLNVAVFGAESGRLAALLGSLAALGGEVALRDAAQAGDGVRHGEPQCSQAGRVFHGGVCRAGVAEKSGLGQLLLSQCRQ